MEKEYTGIIGSMPDFEDHFRFSFAPGLRETLMENSGKRLRGLTLPTEGDPAILLRILSLTELTGEGSAWEINRRIRKYIGEKRKAIGVCKFGDYLCVERDLREQYLTVWNCQTRDYSKVRLPLEDFLQKIETASKT